MVYLLKKYYHYHRGELMEQTLIIMNDSEFEEFKQSHESCGEDAWYGESGGGYDEDKYDSVFEKVELDEGDDR